MIGRRASDPAQIWAQACAAAYRKRHPVRQPEAHAAHHAAMPLAALAEALGGAPLIAGCPVEQRLDASQQLARREFDERLMRCLVDWSSVLRLGYGIVDGAAGTPLPPVPQVHAPARPLLARLADLRDGGHRDRAEELLCRANQKFHYSHAQASKQRAGASFEWEIEYLWRSHGLDYGAQVRDPATSSSCMDFVVFAPASIPPDAPAATRYAHAAMAGSPVPVSLTTTMNDTGDKLGAQAGGTGGWFAMTLHGGGNHPRGLLTPSLVAKVTGRGGTLVCYGAMKNAILASPGYPAGVEKHIMAIGEMVDYLRLRPSGAEPRGRARRWWINGSILH